jgi:DNA-binding beta-propeller fold protein YncE
VLAQNAEITRAPAPLSPSAVVVTADATRAYVSGATVPVILEVDLARGEVAARIPAPGPVNGLALAPDQDRLIATCPGPRSTVAIVDLAERKVTSKFTVGHSAIAPALSQDGNSLWVAHQFQHEVAEVDLGTGRILGRVAVEREPVATALTADGGTLLVANLLHDRRADVGHIAAAVSVIDTAQRKVIKTLRLPNGSGYLNDIAISPDGRWACVTHILSRYPLPTTQLERGWINTNAQTLIDLESMTILNTVLLDNVDRGAANPWGVAWSADSQVLIIAHAGTHEVSVIDVPGLVTKLTELPEKVADDAPNDYRTVSRERSDVPNDLAFLVGLRERVPLPENDRGPRAVAVAGNTALIANYFSDTLNVLQLLQPRTPPKSIRLAPSIPMSQSRLGEFYFHDAQLCFQGWQSCSSCHPGDARMDALNWDLLNDGIGNPKNNRSLLYSHRMGPAMSLGVRPTAEEAVRAGIRHILFTVQPEEVATAMDEYLKSLQPIPSPHLVAGGLSESAQRGRELFESEEVGCATCHPGELYSDLKAHDVGTRGPFDRTEDQFFTPTLVELWRTAPYLHDGSAATLRKVIADRNRDDQHGRTSQLSTEQVDDLLAYLLSI